METIKVLIVDDDVISRKLLKTVINKEDDIEVVGHSADGELCLTNIPLQKPDLVTLDIEMPGIGGIETLKRIRASWPDLPVIMYSGHAEEGAAITLEALSLGASDYVTKPQGGKTSEFPLDRLRYEIIPKIRALCSPAAKERIKAKAQARSEAKVKEKTKTVTKSPTVPRPTAVKSARPAHPIDIVTIGISTGGPNALAEMVPNLRADLPVPIVLVQHMPKAFTKLLAERLDENSDIRVVEGSAGMALEAGTLYIAPGDYHMVVERQGASIVLGLNQNEKVNSCRPAVDVLFDSVAKLYGANTLAVVMTGMGADGQASCKTLHATGASILIQDEASCVVWGMPGSVAEAGIPHMELPLEKLAQEINARVSALGRNNSIQSKSA